MGVSVPMLYFGKLPSRGDFVRCMHQPALLQSLDRWLSAGMELMAEDAHWKSIYDRADAADFAMISPHRHTAVAGHILPSADRSGRRFPFVAAATMESCSGEEMAALAPLMLQAPWSTMAAAVKGAHRATDAEADSMLHQLAHAQLPAPHAAGMVRQTYQAYLGATTHAMLNEDLLAAGHVYDVRQLMLALGLLLQPLLGGGGQPIEKGLCLPLPAEDGVRLAHATFWMDLISRFLVRGAYDLTVFLPRGNNHRPCLLIGFSAGAPNVLHGLFDPRVTGEVFISLDQSPWVEEYVAADYALKKFSSYLLMPEMSLDQVLASFQEAFIGE